MHLYLRKELQQEKKNCAFSIFLGNTMKKKKMEINF